MSKVRAFLKAEFGDGPRLRALFVKYDALPPTEASATKYFQRGSLPSKWLLPALALLELERGAPVSLLEHFGGSAPDEKGGKYSVFD